MTDAERLARTMWPDNVPQPTNAARLAQRAMDAGWTPPPDPHEDIAREISKECWPESDFDPENPAMADSKILAAVRRMDLRRGTDA